MQLQTYLQLFLYGWPCNSHFLFQKLQQARREDGDGECDPTDAFPMH